MKRKILATLLLGFSILTMVGCSFKVKPNTNINDIEGNGNLIITSNLMQSLRDLGESYEFIPLEYSSGSVRGIISPTKIDEYVLEASNEIRGLNPLRYMEYTINAIKQNSFLQETGNILALNELSSHVLDVKNPENIILRDNKSKIEKSYRSKVSGEFIVTESVAYAGDGSQVKVNDFQNKYGKSIIFQYSNSKIVGKDNRYIYSSFSYSENIDENGLVNDYKNIIVIYDLKTESFYESEIIETENYRGYEDSIFEVNDDLYYFESDGKVSKILLSNGKMLFEEYYDIASSEDLVLMPSYAYTDNNIGGDNIFFNTVKRSSDGRTTYIGESVFNIKDNDRMDLPQGEDYINIHKIFSNSDNLVMVSKRNNISNKIWIAKYKDGEFENLVPIDKIHPNNASMYTQNIENILYDRETNSFFIKRRTRINEKNGYRYEVLKLE